MGRVSEADKQLQYALHALGGNPGTVDGIRGPKTNAALAEIQARHPELAGLEGDELTLAVVGLAGEKTRELVVNQDNLSRDEWRQLQAGLHVMGIDSGPLDGLPGRVTHAALDTFTAREQAFAAVNTAESGQTQPASVRGNDGMQARPAVYYAGPPVITVDVGHGHYIGEDKNGNPVQRFDPGAVVTGLNGEQITEYELNVMLAAQLGRDLEAAGFEVVYTNLGSEADPLANQYEARYGIVQAAYNASEAQQIGTLAGHISVHHNAFVQDASVHGARYYFSSSGNDVSKEWADVLMEQDGYARRDTGYRLERDTPIRTASSSEAGLPQGVPAVLLEPGFMTNPEDLARMMSDAGRMAISHNVVEATVAHYNARRAQDISMPPLDRGQEPVYEANAGEQLSPSHGIVAGLVGDSLNLG